MKTRTNKSYSSLEEIIQALSKHEHAGSIWVGENYSKADLIEDLKKVKEQLKASRDCITQQVEQIENRRRQSTLEFIEKLDRLEQEIKKLWPAGDRR